MNAKPKYDFAKHRRRSIRLRDYDYTREGAYFVTICAYNRACVFGKVVDGEARLSDFGQIVQDCWNEIPSHFPNVELDSFVVMPNHVHGIVVISEAENCRGTACCAPTVGKTQSFGNIVPGSLSAIVRSFKSAVARRINRRRGMLSAPLWQSNYYEHVIRSEDELNRIRQYVADNPTRWEVDAENPERNRQAPVDNW